MRNFTWAVIGSNLTMIPVMLMFNQKVFAAILLVLAGTNMTFRFLIEKKSK